jgi:hypothetical protein
MNGRAVLISQTLYGSGRFAPELPLTSSRREETFVVRARRLARSCQRSAPGHNFTPKARSSPFVMKFWLRPFRSARATRFDLSRFYAFEWSRKFHMNWFLRALKTNPYETH